jgi:GT2 family glycosyltransferase
MIILSIIIVNYKAPGLVVDCLQTIFTTNKTSNVEVIIVDNFQDDSEAIIKWFPQVRWIQMDSNSGFARANNAGIRAANGKIVLLLNSDTLNENDAIAQCAGCLETSDYVACGVQLLNPDGSPQVSGNYFTTGGLNQLMMLPIVGKVARWLGYTMRVKSTNVPNAEGIVKVDWINGAFLMAKKEAIDKAGLLNEFLSSKK